MADAAVGRREMVRDHLLVHDVEFAHPPVALLDGEDIPALARWQAPQLRDVDFDYEAAPGLEVVRGVLEAPDLCVLTCQVDDGVEDQIDEVERAGDCRGRHVAKRHREFRPAPLGAELVDHRRRQFDALHRNPAGDQRERNTPGPDRELGRGPAVGELGEPVYRRLDGLRREHRSVLGVVVRRDRSAEMVFGHRPDARASADTWPSQDHGITLGPVVTESTRMTQRVALVTGASQGLGLALVDGLAVRMGPDDIVYLTGRDLGRVEDAAAGLPARSAEIRTELLDVSDDEAVERAAALLADRHGGVDVVFSNAYRRTQPADDPAEVIGEYVDTN